MPSLRRSLAAILLALSAAGCVPSSTAAPAPGPRRTDSQAISSEQIREQEQIGVGNMLDVVRRLRPSWLTARGPRSIVGGETVTVVYMEQVLLGGVEALANIDPQTVESVRKLDAAQAISELPGLGSARIQAAIVMRRRRS